MHSQAVSRDTIISREVAHALSTKAIQVPAIEVNTWLFGGCNPDPDIRAYISASFKVLGYDDHADESNFDKLETALTALVGRHMAAEVIVLLYNQEG